VNRAEVALARWVSIRSAIRKATRSVRAGLAESLTALAFVGGWVLITDGLVHLRWFAPGVVWRLSIGLLAISLGGWQFLGQIAMRGLYQLNLEDKG